MKKITLFAIAIAGASSLFAQKRISAEEANKYVGENVTVTGKIVGGKFAEKYKKPSTILNMGGNGSSTAVSIVINNENRKNFPYNPEDYLSNKRVSVTGKVTEAKGRPEILINGPEDVKVEEGQSGEIKPLEFDSFNRYFQD
jgi:DNA/RNA endonuclease YhcR with UshA esterase domain